MASIRSQTVVAASDQRTQRPRSRLAGTGAAHVIDAGLPTPAATNAALTGASKPSTSASPVAAVAGDDEPVSGANAAHSRASATYAPPACASARTASMVA